MRDELIEIYSDATNAAIMRHPARRFPGLLLQGDTLHSLCVTADRVCSEIGSGQPGFEEADYLRTDLWEFLNHYIKVLKEEGLPLPFVEEQA